MGRRFRLSLALIWAMTSLFVGEGLAYVPTVTSRGVPVHWRTPVHLRFVGNSNNHCNLDPSDLFDASVAGLQRWKKATLDQIQFDYWQGTDPKRYPIQSDRDGLSTIYFGSQAKNPTLTPNILGLTQVWYNTETGEITETDIVLNDLDFNFTNNPDDTSGYGTSHPSFRNGKNNVFVQNVLTHEMGHVLGLSHSGGLQSTMLFMESPEQAYLGCDEMVAAPALYPSRDLIERGQLFGRLFTETGKPLFGAHVVAISQTRGTVLATAITNPRGEYLIDALEPGPYFLMTEPYYAGPQALPSFYNGIDPSICENKTPFSRTFLTGEDPFRLEVIQIIGGQRTTAPPFRVRCMSAGGASIHLDETRSSTSPSPRPVFDGQAGAKTFARVDRLELGTNSFLLRQLSGNLTLHALGYSLYSPVDITLSLQTSEGEPIEAHLLQPVYQGESGYINHDSTLTATDLPRGDYVIKLSPSRLQANDYPAGPLALDSVPFVVLTGTLNGGEPPLASIPNNSRCRMLDQFPRYVSPPEGPPAASSDLPSSDVGFCGTLRSHSSNSRSEARFGPMPPNGPKASSIAGWFVPWILIFLSRFLHLPRAWILLQSLKRPVTFK